MCLARHRVYTYIANVLPGHTDTQKLSLILSVVHTALEGAPPLQTQRASESSKHKSLKHPVAG